MPAPLRQRSAAADLEPDGTPPLAAAGPVRRPGGTAPRDRDMRARRVIMIVTKLTQAGGQLVALQIARSLRERGHEAQTWFLYREHDAFEAEPATRVLLEQARPGVLGYARIFLDLVRALREYRPDAVYTLLPLGNVMGAFAAWLLRVPVRVASQHNPRDTQSPVMRVLDWAMGSLGVYSTNVAVSHAVAATYAGAGKRYLRRLRVIPNGHALRPCPLSRPEARARLGLPPAAFVMGAVGRVAPQKNPEHAIELVRRLPSAHLAWAGDGPLRAEIERTIEGEGLAGRVHLLGQISEDAMPVFFRAVDIVVMPSRYEGLPLALLEAMHAGVPVVASDIPPMAEVAVGCDGTPAARLVTLDDLEGWLAAVMRLQDDPVERQRLAAVAASAIRRFSLPRMVDDYEALLEPGGSAPPSA